jgi:GNAT superfamily N-acetyltransferase
MIRLVEKEDLPKIKAVIDSSNLFAPGLLDDMIAGFFNRTEESIWLTHDDDEPIFVAYAAPEEMTIGTWKLHLIAIHQNHQGKGIGGIAMGHMEDILKARGERILLVETPVLDNFEDTLKFYLEKGYTLEARISDFYQEGQDKIIFWKRLN